VQEIEGIREEAEPLGTKDNPCRSSAKAAPPMPMIGEWEHSSAKEMLSVLQDPQRHPLLKKLGRQCKPIKSTELSVPTLVRIVQY
jgi:hypothetical protein